MKPSDGVRSPSPPHSPLSSAAPGPCHNEQRVILKNSTISRYFHCVVYFPNPKSNLRQSALVCGSSPRLKSQASSLCSCAEKNRRKPQPSHQLAPRLLFDPPDQLRRRRP